MKTILSVLIALLIPLCALQAQEKDWSRMSTKEKQDYMVKLSYEIIKEFGPGYYRGNAPYIFEEDTYKGGHGVTEKYNGRKLYIVKFLYDPSLERLEMDYLAKVGFLADTGEPSNVMFGCNLGKNFLKKPYKQQKAEPHEPIPFYRTHVPLSTLQTAKANAVVSPKERQLIERCVELIKKYGPEYYNPDANYNIDTAIYNLDGKRDAVSQNNGREYYLVTFDYDLNKGLMKNYFSAAIRIWKDTDEVWNITFGNDEEFNF